jgi:hypothetical protein
METGNATYEPGHPIDLRPEKRKARLFESPTGDFEARAARVVARLTGERVILQDDGSSDGMVDIRIEHADGRIGYVEVWADVDPGWAATYSRLLKSGNQLPLEIPIATLNREWFIVVSGASRLDVLEAELRVLLGDLEDRGETYETVAIKEALVSNGSPSVGRLLELGVVETSSRPAPAGQSGIVRIYVEGVTGPSTVDWAPVVEWIEDTLNSDRLADVRMKLGKTGALERHVFVGLTFSSPGEVFFSLSPYERTLPGLTPTLPPEISDLWIMQVSSAGRCLALFPMGGWIDVIDHWATS